MIDSPLPISFQKLLSDHERIRIPRLQRDYAQGRKGAKETEVRERFLSDLRDALEHGGGSPPLNLDFVYGSAETNPDKHFSPLDGQQRLTTLFLLHWLLAWRAGRWDDFTNRFREGGRSRFSYSVRTSSTEFFDMLVGHRPPAQTVARDDLKGWITDQSWYFRYWRLDPTIQAVLEMLQAMHLLFLDLRPVELYARLTDEERPAITFQLLNLGDFALSDDLYIKMNARGIPLTTFENFKGRYEQMLPAHFALERPRDIQGVLFPMAKFVARRMDTAWTDYFWAYHRTLGQLDPQRIDGSFMNVFRMVALASLDPEKETFRAEIELLRDAANPPAWSAFEKHGWLDSAFSAHLVSLMESWCGAGMLLPPENPLEERAILGQLFEDPAELTVPQVLLFCGYAFFIHEYEGRLNAAQFDDWMRIVHNLGVNSDIDRNDRLLDPVKALRELLPHAAAILDHLARRTEKLSGFTKQQLDEEKLKAALIVSHDEWRTRISRAERHAYFKGQIQHLLDFCEATAEAEVRSPLEWDVQTHLRFQERFDFYLARAEAMFGDDGLKPMPERLWPRALLALGDILLPTGKSGDRWSFPIDAKTEPTSWKRLLRGGDLSGKRQQLQKLWDRLTLSVPVETELRAIIAGAADLSPWTEALVRTPHAQDYCGKNIICWWSDDPTEREARIYLLSGTTMGSDHAELFTYCLYHDALSDEETRRNLLPLTVCAYRAVWGKEAQPHIPLVWERDGHRVEFRIEYPWRCYRIRVPSASLELFPVLRESLLSDNAGFTEEEGSLGKACPRENIKAELRSLAALLRIL